MSAAHTSVLKQSPCSPAETNTVREITGMKNSRFEGPETLNLIRWRKNAEFFFHEMATHDSLFINEYCRHVLCAQPDLYLINVMDICIQYI